MKETFSSSGSLSYSFLLFFVSSLVIFEILHQQQCVVWKVTWISSMPTLIRTSFSQTLPSFLLTFLCFRARSRQRRWRRRWRAALDQLILRISLPQGEPQKLLGLRTTPLVAIRISVHGRNVEGWASFLEENFQLLPGDGFVAGRRFL